jgi:hypothetical protein
MPNRSEACLDRCRRCDIRCMRDRGAFPSGRRMIDCDRNLPPPNCRLNDNWRNLDQIHHRGHHHRRDS